MDRKEFLAGLVVLGAGATHAGATQVPDEGKEKFKQAWISSLMEKLDAQLSESARTKLMEACGRACAGRGAAAGMAKAAGGDVDKLVATLAGHIGKENARRDGRTVHLRYNKCYCPLVSAGPPRLSNTFCNCSRGWLMEVFEAVTGKPVRVEITSSIKRGDPYCAFAVRT